MAKVISTIKAVLTRIIFSAHSLIAVWQVTQNKDELIYWTLCGPIALLVIEGVFTLAIKKNQEWRWFCPSVFLYLGSVVPAIWLLELEKVQKRLQGKEATFNLTSLDTNIKDINELLGGNIKIPDIHVDAQTWTTLIEQFLMLILIVGRWLLPKGDLTRDQLSQLLLVYIGTAADIIEFFDSYKDDSIAKVPLLVYLTLGIWSWSLLQFTIVLSATRARKPRGGGTNQDEGADCCGDCCCGIDVWGIALNVILQDAPFLTFRLLIIVHYNIINYMNVFFTCKNSLVILLQLYRLYVVNSEHWKMKRERKLSKLQSRKFKKRSEENLAERQSDIYVISTERSAKRKSKRIRDDSDEDISKKCKPRRERYTRKQKKRTRKDTGYSTASSQNTRTTKAKEDRSKIQKKEKKRRKRSSSSDSESEYEVKKRRNKSASRKKSRREKQHFDAVLEESSRSTDSSERFEIVNEKQSKKKRRRKSPSSSSAAFSSSSTSSD